MAKKRPIVQRSPAAVGIDAARAAGAGEAASKAGRPQDRGALLAFPEGFDTPGAHAAFMAPASSGDMQIIVAQLQRIIELLEAGNLEAAQAVAVAARRAP